MQPQIFVSHSHRDSAIAESLVDFLEGRGMACWRSGRDIHAGDNWAEALDRAIDESDIMLFLLSTHSNQDKDQVLRELEQANNQRIPILTYRIEDIAPSHGIRYFIRATQYCDAFDRSSEDVGRELLESVKSLVSGEKRSFRQPPAELRLPPSGPPAGSQLQVERESRFRLSSPLGVTLASAAAILVCIVALFLVSQLRDRQPPPSEEPGTAAPPGTTSPQPGSSEPDSPGTTPPETTPPKPSPSAGDQPAVVEGGLEERARNGDVQAMLKLALKYSNQDKDFDRSFYWSQQAAKRGDADGMFILAQHYLAGRGVEKDTEQGIDWCKKAAAAGNASAAIIARRLKQDPPEEEEQLDADLLRKAEGGDAEAQFQIGVLHQKRHDFDEAMPWLLRAAKGGHARAMTEIGTMFYAGWGVEKDNEKAVEWWTKGAEAGCEVAKHNLKIFRQKHANPAGQ